MSVLFYNILDSFSLYQALSVICVALSVLCALFITVVVMIQPGNSNGISALNGTSDTFYGKNKSKTVESKLRRLTVICLIVLTVLMIGFFLLQFLMPVGA